MADREKDVQIAETHRDRDVNAITNKDREVSIAAAFKMKVLVKRKLKEILV
jgi:flotillin